MIEQALTTLINSVSGLMPYPAKLEQSPALPGITYQRITTARGYTHSGAGKKARPRFQLNIWDDSYLGVITLARTIRSGINGYRGTLGGVTIESLVIANQIDGMEEAPDHFRVIMDIEMYHNEEVS